MNSSKSPYKYQCRDYSILTPYFKKYFVAPTVHLTPYQLPANFITIASFLFVILAFILLQVINYNNFLQKLTIPILIYLYAHGDTLDGMQAKRTKTSSKLGEFCDHFLDVITNGIIILIIFKFLQIENSYILNLTIFSNYMLHSAIIHEQNKTGSLIFDKIGPLEAIFFTILLLMFSTNKFIFDFLKSEILYGNQIIEYAFIVMNLATLINCAIVIKRSGTTQKFTIHMILSSLMLMILLLSIDSLKYVPIFIMYQVFFIGSLISNHLLKCIYVKNDYISPLILLLTELLNISYLRYFIVFYISLNLIKLLYQIILKLKTYWLWSNPIQKKSILKTII